ncbi:hypothetical protein J4225_04105 [Candidatus Pacearchaeota archaeon]|nr:hypothetical protein [Candidatus Pacearchaeota archaeon]
MNTKIFLVSLAVLLVAASVASAATYHGSFGVDVGGGRIVIGSGGCEEDWSSSTWSSCNNNQQTFICIDKNQCGTVNLKPVQCGNTQACNASSVCGNSIVEAGESCDDGNTTNGDGCSSTCATESNNGGGGGGGGGGSSSSNSPGVTPLSLLQETCIERWQCDAWSNEDNECGSRECRDTNNCGTEELKPLTIKQCPNQGWAGITGNIIGGVANFAKSKAGAGLIFIAVVVAAAMVIMNKKKLVDNKKKQ